MSHHLLRFGVLAHGFPAYAFEVVDLLDLPAMQFGVSTGTVFVELGTFPARFFLNLAMEHCTCLAHSGLGSNHFEIGAD